MSRFQKASIADCGLTVLLALQVEGQAAKACAAVAKF
jgi:hypothetical protein